MKVKTGKPASLDSLLSYYRVAQRKYDVDWSVLAAINMVESLFGRVRSDSEAGGRGPMQFEPATWDEYGLGGDIEDPRDAILAAANYLAASGAPSDYSQALLAYDASSDYGDAVQLLAKAMDQDEDLITAFYFWTP